MGRPERRNETSPGPVAPVPARRPWPFWARFVQLQVGLFLYGLSAAMLVRGRLGLDPWDVFHQGLSRTFGLSIGAWVILVGGAVLLLWIPLRQRPGIGTISNVLLIGVWLDVTLLAIPYVHAIGVRWAFECSPVDTGTGTPSGRRGEMAGWFSSSVVRIAAAGAA